MTKMKIRILSNTVIRMENEGGTGVFLLRNNIYKILHVIFNELICIIKKGSL